MDIKKNMEEWKRIYESTLKKKYNLARITESVDDDDSDPEEQDNDELRDEYPDYYKDSKDKYFVELTEMYYVPKKGEDPLDHILSYDDWYNTKLQKYGSFKEFERKTLKFDSFEDAKKEVVKRFSEIRRKYKGIEVENFRVINENDIPSVFRKADPNALGFIYNYIPTQAWSGDTKVKYTDGKETHTMAEWAEKLGITYQQFAKAIRDGEVRIKKDKDGNKIEPYTIFGNKYKKAEEKFPNSFRRFQNSDKSVMMFIYYIYKAPHRVFIKSGLSKLANAYLKMNSTPEYYAEVQRKMLERKRRALKQAGELYRKTRNVDIDDGVGSEWKRSVDMDQDEMDARRADVFAKANNNKPEDLDDLDDLDTYDLGGDGSYGDDDDGPLEDGAEPVNPGD